MPHKERPGKIVHDVSAGGVIVRRRGSALEVVLVGLGDPTRWTIPKGAPALGESLEQTAIREVREESGLEVRILAPLEKIVYWFSIRGVRHHKTVHFYLLEAIGGDTANHDWEHEHAKWFPAAEALSRISFANESTILVAAIERSQPSYESARGSGAAGLQLDERVRG